LLSLFPGNPLQEPNTEFSGVGSSAAAAALNSFEAAIGGGNNTKTSPGVPVASGTGFRTITWDGVKLDGTDFGGGANTTVVNTGKTVVIPKNRFIGQGAFFGDPYAVSGDGFADVGNNVTGLFPAFSSPNTFAMTNDNTIDMSFNLATTGVGSTGTPVPAATRGFGAIFLNNEEINNNPNQASSTIEYFSGDKSLGVFKVPFGQQGQAEFLGELFPDAVVTRVSLTLGTDTLFSFDGVNFTKGSNQNNPGAGHNLVVTDDFSYAEPVPLNSDPPIISGSQGTLNAQTAVSATVGTAVTTVVATFSDTAATAAAQNYTANINWGDGHITNGAVTANGRGGFNVSGTNTYGSAGLFPLSVDVEKFEANPETISLTNTAQVAAANTTTSLSLSSSSTQFGQPLTLTAVVSPAPNLVPGSLVVFKDGSNVIGTGNLDKTGTASFSISNLPAGSHSFSATYPGSFSFNTSTSQTQTATISSNITPQLQITPGRITGRRGRFAQTVTVRNNGGNALSGPVFFVLAGLSPRVKLINQSGLSSQVGQSPFVTIPLGPANLFSPGQTVALTFNFATNLNPRRILYANLVLGGINQP
jgi:hypothetical protein